MQQKIPCFMCGGVLKRLRCSRCGIQYLKKKDGIQADKWHPNTHRALERLSSGKVKPRKDVLKRLR